MFLFRWGFIKRSISENIFIYFKIFTAWNLKEMYNLSTKPIVEWKFFITICSSDQEFFFIRYFVKKSKVYIYFKKKYKTMFILLGQEIGEHSISDLSTSIFHCTQKWLLKYCKCGKAHYRFRVKLDKRKFKIQQYIYNILYAYCECVRLVTVLTIKPCMCDDAFSTWECLKSVLFWGVLSLCMERDYWSEIQPNHRNPCHLTKEQKRILLYTPFLGWKLSFWTLNSWTFGG